MTVAIESGLAKRYFYSIYSHEFSKPAPYSDEFVTEIFKFDKVKKAFNDLYSVAYQIRSAKETMQKFSAVICDLPLHRNSILRYNLRMLGEANKARKNSEMLDDPPLGKKEANLKYVECLADLDVIVAQRGLFIFKVTEILTARLAETIWSFMKNYANIVFYASPRSKYLSKEWYVIGIRKNDARNMNKPADLKLWFKSLTVFQSLLYGRLAVRYRQSAIEFAEPYFLKRSVVCRETLRAMPTIGETINKLIFRETQYEKDMRAYEINLLINGQNPDSNLSVKCTMDISLLMQELALTRENALFLYDCYGADVNAILIRWGSRKDLQELYDIQKEFGLTFKEAYEHKFPTFLPIYDKFHEIIDYGLYENNDSL